MGVVSLCVTCDFTEFFHDLGLALGLGNVAHKKAQVWDANVNFQMFAAFHFHIIQLYVYIATQSPLILHCVCLSEFIRLYTSISSPLIIFCSPSFFPSNLFLHNQAQLNCKEKESIVCPIVVSKTSLEQPKSIHSSSDNSNNNKATCSFPLNPNSKH